ncbi:hypothetical protein N7467_008448 [Penicillium canescens]|nr:hypothetical protein N7467_008448 [Penicillium canescens]
MRGHPSDSEMAGLWRGILKSTLTTTTGDHGCSCGSSCQCPAGACNCPISEMLENYDMTMREGYDTMG